MDDETVLALSTGRADLLKHLFSSIRERLAQPAPGRHWLVTGPRGAGKSFFLRLVQASFQREPGMAGATFVLLPEEHANIFSPHEFLAEVERLLPTAPSSMGKPPAWQVKDSDSSWNEALKTLFAACPSPLLIVGVENFDQLLETAFDDDVSASRLRTLMENEPRFMLLATAVEGEFDEDYERRLFRQFQHREMPRWDEKDHRSYLWARAKLIAKKPTPLQFARIDAYSRFTGGNARVAAVMAGIILDEDDPLHASSNLTATLDKMTDYYRSLHERMPANTRKVFDALVRGGEPASQSEVAARMGARQNDISRAFGWLVDYGYVLNDRIKGQKENRYRVADRLFVQFYRMRYMQPDSRPELGILADLLAETIEFSRKWNYARDYLTTGYASEAKLMAELACADRDVDIALLPEESRSAEKLVELRKTWEFMDEIAERFSVDAPEDGLDACFRRFRSEEEFRDEYNNAKNLALAVSRERVSGTSLVYWIEDQAFTPMERFRLFSWMLNPDINAEIWKAVMSSAASAWGEMVQHGIVKEDATLSTYKELRFPLATSLDLEVERLMFDASSGPKAKEWLIDRATQAADLWLKAGRIADAQDSLGHVWRTLPDLLRQPRKVIEAMERLDFLKAHFEKLPKEHEVSYYCLLGSAQAEAGFHTKAIANLKKAVVNAPETKLASAIWIYHASIGNSHLALHQHAEGLKHLETAWKGLESDGQPEKAAYMLGHLVRHMMLVQSPKQGLEMLEKEKKRVSGNPAEVMVGLCEAVREIEEKKGRARAYQLALEVVNFFAERVDHGLISNGWLICYAMIDGLVSPALVRDISGEIASLFRQDPNFAQRQLRLLGLVINHLEATPDQRLPMMINLDPDAARTVNGIVSKLATAARDKYQIVTGTTSEQR